MSPKEHKNTPAVFFDIRPRGSPEQPAWLITHSFIYNTLMLKQQVVLECNCANATENWGPHKVIRVRAEAVDYICAHIRAYLGCIPKGQGFPGPNCLMSVSSMKLRALRDGENYQLTVIIPHVDHRYL